MAEDLLEDVVEGQEQVEVEDIMAPPEKTDVMMKVPPFSGDNARCPDLVHKFIQAVESQVATCNLTDKQACKVARSAFTGTAMMWYTSLENKARIDDDVVGFDTWDPVDAAGTRTHAGTCLKDRIITTWGARFDDGAAAIREAGCVQKQNEQVSFFMMHVEHVVLENHKEDLQGNPSAEVKAQIKKQIEREQARIFRKGLRSDLHKGLEQAQERTYKAMTEAVLNYEANLLTNSKSKVGVDAMTHEVAQLQLNNNQQGGASRPRGQQQTQQPRSIETELFAELKKIGQRIDAIEKSKGSNSGGSGSSGNGNRQGKKDKKKGCHICSEEGHFYRECRYYDQKSVGSSKKAFKENAAQADTISVVVPPPPPRYSMPHMPFNPNSGF